MDRVRSTAIAVAVLVTTAIAVPAVAGVVTAQEQGQQIDECTTIDESGTYELNGSIGVANASENQTTAGENASLNETDATGDSNDTSLPAETGVVEEDANASACIAVEASDVTFDGNGYALDGSDASELNLSGNDSVAAANASGDVGASAGENESVVNGIVIRPATDDGTVSNVTITNVTVQNWYVGVYIQNAQNVTLDNVTFANNTVPGFRLDNSTGLTLRNVNQTGA